MSGGGDTLMSIPFSETMTSAVRRCSASNPPVDCAGVSGGTGTSFVQEKNRAGHAVRG